MREFVLPYEPQPKQRLLHETPARQVFYGGAAGGGKSHALRFEAYIACLQNPGLDAFLFRRTLGELEDNHIRKISNEIPREVAQWNETKKRLEFANGAGINFCYCEREKDVERYQGAEIHLLLIDEAAHLTEYQINYLRGRARLGSFVPQAHKPVERGKVLGVYKDDPSRFVYEVEGRQLAFRPLFPRIILTSNPGGPGHSFLKRTFVTAGPAQELFFDSTLADPGLDGHPGWLSLFIPAGMKDNRYLDAGYAGQFQGLPDERRRMLVEGDWDAVAGAALPIDRARHMLPAFDPPRHWTRFMAMDWGSAKPFSIGWYTVADEATDIESRKLGQKWVVPEGALIRYRELYGWNGKDNQGCRKPAKDVAKEVLEIERRHSEVIDYRVADSAMWSSQDGPSPAERFMQGGMTEDGVSRSALRSTGKKDRKAAYAEWIARLNGEDFNGTRLPMFYATENCTHFWRTMPTLTVDETDPEKGPDTNLEDHVYDEGAYALMSRPYITTEEDRWTSHVRQHQRKTADPYATR